MLVARACARVACVWLVLVLVARGSWRVARARACVPAQVRRFHTAGIVAGLRELDALAKRAEACKGDATRKVFARFASAGGSWARAVRCMATLDALAALANVSSQAGYSRPVIVSDSSDSSDGSDGSPAAASSDGADGVVLELQQAKHPCLILPPGAEAIPNDISLGGRDASSGGPAPRLLLLTGPNMGGKSTLLRQTCLLAIMAQVGCFVPAEHAALSPIDRVFTRLGASDRILAGQSTFFVELSEAATVLRHATHR